MRVGNKIQNIFLGYPYVWFVSRRKVFFYCKFGISLGCNYCKCSYLIRGYMEFKKNKLVRRKIIESFEGF